MSDDDQVRWLSIQEMRTWRAFWATLVWLPARLDSQLKRDTGLSQPEYHTLSQLSEAPGRTCRLSELAATANMTLSHLSRVVTRLQAAGWLERRTDPADGRRTFATLTDSGVAKVVEAAPSHVEAVRRYVFDVMTPAQAQSLGEAAALIVEALDPPLRGGRPRLESDPNRPEDPPHPPDPAG